MTEVTRAQLMQMEAETAARKALAELDEEDRMSVGVGPYTHHYIHHYIHVIYVLCALYRMIVVYCA